jgi:aminopeptidase N
MADYLVRFQAPDHYRVFGSGTEATGARDDGTILTEMRASLSREFALTVMPGASGGEVTTGSARAGDVDLSLILPNAFMIPGLEETVMQTAADAFPVYEAWLGAYPGKDLEITVGDLSGASAVSWAGTIWLDLESAVADGKLNEFEQIRLRFIVIHEIGHQWIGNVIGANTNDHQFMSEGLVNMLSVAVINEIAGPADAERYLRADVAGPYQALLRDGRDGVADRAITPELNGVLHGMFVYGKAGVGFEAIRQATGDQAFFDGMSAYGEAFRFGIAGPDDLRAALETASGQDLEELWSFWFKQERTREADVIAVLDGYAASAAD